MKDGNVIVTGWGSEVIVTRRNLMRAAAAASGLALLNAPRTVTALTEHIHSDTAVILDPRIDESIRFARQFSAEPERYYTIETDVVDLWYDSLHELSADRNSAIAGLTREPDWFVLKQFSRVHQYAPLVEDKKGAKGGPGLVAWVLAPI